MLESIESDSGAASRHEHRPELGPFQFLTLLVGAVILGAVIQLLLLNQGIYAVSADSSARILNAHHFSQTSTLNAAVWPPLFRVVIGSCLNLWHDLFVVPRIVTFFFGIAVVLLLAWLSHELFQSRRITVTTAILVALLPERVVLSLVPLVEIMYVALVVTGVIFLWRWLDGHQMLQLILATVCFALASSARYEGWFFAASCGFLVTVVLVQSRPRGSCRQLLVAGAILAAFPCFWLALHIIQHGNLDWITQASGPRYQLLYGTSWLRMLPRTLAAQFFDSNLRSLNLIGLISLTTLAVGSRRMRRWILVPGFAFAVISVLAVAGKAIPSHNFWRVAAVWNVLLIPFTAHWLVDRWQRFSFRPILRIAAGLLTIIVITVLCTFRILNLTASPSFGCHELAVARQLEHCLSTSATACKVLIDTSTIRYFHVQVASQYPDDFVLNTGRDPRHPNQHGIVNIASRRIDMNRIKELSVGYVVFHGLPSRDFLDLEVELERVAIHGPWTIYQATGPRPPQLFEGVIRPQDVRYKSGFFPDNNWTDGDASLNRILFVVPKEHSYLVVNLHGHPFGDDLERLAVRIIVNELELNPAGGDRHRLRFRLPIQLDKIQTIRILSSTFSPHEVTGTSDRRHLGIAIKSIKTEEGL